MISFTKSACVKGFRGEIIEVETDIVNGLPCFELVGLSGKVANEARERVRSAVRNSGYVFPMKRVIVNMSPAGIHKEGSHYDLSIAVGLLSASVQLCAGKNDLEKYIFIGELSLDGRVNPVRGVLPMLIEAVKNSFSGVVMPRGNIQEALMVKGLRIISVENLFEAVEFSENTEIDEFDITERSKPEINNSINYVKEDFSDVKGQRYAKRALEIAAAGNHNCLMTGSPGSGKTMLAKRVPGILPEMTDSEALETAIIYSIAGLSSETDIMNGKRPFRAPHHGTTAVNLVGGGWYPTPGEVSLAHNGVLFLDEICEFNPAALDMLREPMAAKTINVSRKNGTVNYPSDFMLVAAANPCKCGLLLEKGNICTCTPKDIEKYRNRLSGALLDRIDIKIKVLASGTGFLKSDIKEESSEDIRKRVVLARKIQLKRFKNDGIICNSQMDNKQIRNYAAVNDRCLFILEKFEKKGNLSIRGYISVLKLARTIADLEGQENVTEDHIIEALQYRVK